jgi:hypothetical protein
MTVTSTAWTRGPATAALFLAALLASSCGDVVRDSRSPSQLLIVSLQGSSGATPDQFGSTVLSDVVTNVKETIGSTTIKVPTIFNDLGQATFRVQLRDPGQPGLAAAPSAINAVTISQYHVTYRRSDGRNIPGVDVPYGFDGAITLTVSGGADASAGFDLVRHAAKEEAPLRALATSPSFIATIADITFYGKDQAGNTLSASGSISVTFGNFGDPE